MAKVLSRRISAIEYRHADDGLDYRHDFTKAGGEILLESDGSLRVENPGARLWKTYAVKNGTQPFLVNPPGGAMKKRRKGKMPAGLKRYWASRRHGAKKRRNPPKSAAAPTRRRRKRRSGVTSMVKRSRRRSMRRNPSLSFGSITDTLLDGAMGGAAVVAGMVATRLVSSQFDFEDGSVADAALEVGTALAIGLLMPRVIGPVYARDMMNGAFAAPIASLVESLKIPHVSSLISGTEPSNTRVLFPPADRNMSGYARIQGYGPPAPGAKRPLLLPSTKLNGVDAIDAPIDMLSVALRAS